ncbi:hypothetical protein HYH03_012835 [Edaphochlamys debaryana]|uniref:Amine oxidase domain-containing protein n=1 Tax=Edaphochlamys debaryana TaxID=47281 RepID=A0A835XZY5_9CHLO|nr:hypothetical protein HYH03_012835 [Edaphochlamys debaryana]|eukprot:KAG2488674.1 hypothetical protein HYH03_012835 [Edaphochlamys debaryana]
MARLPCLFVLAVAALAAGAYAKKYTRDVCILGGGPAGLSAAAFAKDRGLSVIVLERENVYGGNCNTEKVDAGPDKPAWLDTGVIAHANTTALQALFPADGWTLESPLVAERFAPGLLLPYPTTAQTPAYLVDWAGGNFSAPYGPLTGGSPDAFLAAFGRLLDLVKTIPWLNRGRYPDPVPPELLRPFSAIIEEHQLQPLVPTFFHPILSALGLTNYSDPEVAPAYLTLLYLKPALLLKLTTPGYGFTIKGGCIKVYDGMVAHIGAANVILRANVRRVTRPAADALGGAVSVDFSVGLSQRSHTASCQHLLVAYPQTPTSLQPLDLDAKEAKAFETFKGFYLYTLEVAVEGPLASQAYNFINADLSSPGAAGAVKEGRYPGLNRFIGSMPGFPAAGVAVALEPLSTKAMRKIVKAQLAKVPTSYITKATILKIDAHTNYFPHASTASLAGPSPNAYAQREALQGYRRTRWISNQGDVALAWQNSYAAVQAL